LNASLAGRDELEIVVGVGIQVGVENARENEGEIQGLIHARFVNQ
jgi:hypothetical protein